MIKKSLKNALLALTALAMFSAAFALPNNAETAVKQQILVEPVKGITNDFMRGVDISSLADIEKAGGKFYNAQGKQDDLFNILKEHGVNWIRLRVWNNPTVNGRPYGGGNNSVAVDVPLAVRAKKAGMKILVDFHYSDTWADPGKQNMPQDWARLNDKQLAAEVEKFTKESIQKFIDAGARPDMVQIGNELNNGFMWPLGKIWGSTSSEKVGGMKGFTDLLKSASKGVRAAQGKGDKMRIMVHLANGGDNNLYRQIFDQVKSAGIDYDVIGLSFYTYWHGAPTALRNNLKDLSSRYGKELVVVETAYAFTEDDGDEQGNVFQVFSDERTGYRPSVQGQATAVRDIIDVVASVKGGAGVFYWEPAWIPVKGAGLSATEGDTWENQAMFDFKGRALPSLAVWNLVYGKGAVTNAWGGSAKNGGGFVPYDMADKIKIETLPGVAPDIPKNVKIMYTNDKESLILVSWEQVDWKSKKTPGIVKVTGKLTGCDFKPVAEIEISNKVNLIEDNSFESGKLGKWTLNGPGEACFVENNKSNARTGKWTYKYWLDKGFKSTLTQKFTGLANGTYTFSVWAMGGGGENTIRILATGHDNTKKQITGEVVNTGWKNWKQYKIQIPVTSGQCTIGIYLDTQPGNWGNFDDVEFYKN